MNKPMNNPIMRLAVLGSTGSIGKQTLEVVRWLGDSYRIAALAAGCNTSLLAEQIAEFKPDFVSWQKGATPPNGDFKLLTPKEIASHPDIDIVVLALPSAAGLEPALAAAKTGKRLALANKESLVSAGEIIMAEAAENDALIIPVDSEHSAIWQCLSGENEPPQRIILTASGGPFRGYTKSQLEKVTPQQALSHPSWKMGRKVTIDSATLMNKGLEIIEAHWLFCIPYENIEVTVHQQSIVHSMVEFSDGSVKAQLSYPDMRLPIQYAITYPQRLVNNLRRLDWNGVASLNFQLPDLEAFPCLKLAREAGEKDGSYPAVLCAADEAAVKLFLDGRINFTDIASLVARTLDRHKSISNPSIEEIKSAAAWATDQTLKTAETAL
jgi:1-deoxy-D-xylulose-5-phosphate reductoisomerase